MFIGMNSTKMLFLTTLIMSTMLAISANSWIGCWMGLEINLLSFIPQMMPLNWVSLFSSESAMKYFLIQSIASVNFLFSIVLIFILMKMSLKINNFIISIMNISLLMKLGAAPLHSWFPKIMENLTWVNCFILSTWQKIAPLVLISYCLIYKLILFSICLSVLVGSITGLNQTLTRNIMSYSSINHLGWLLMALLVSNNMLNLYLIIYMFLNLNIMMMFNLNNFSHLNQIFSSSMPPLYKNLFMFNFLSLGGLPPFLGFLPKWMLINFMSEMNLYLVCMIMLMTTLINLFYYIRLMYASFTINYFENKWYKYKISSYNFKLINMMNSLSFMGLILINFMYYFI